VSDAALRAVERDAPGTEAHAAALARAGRWVEAEKLYRALYVAAREEEWSVALDLADLPISETRGPFVSDRCRELAARRKGLIRAMRRLSRARIDAERRAGGKRRGRRA
jgi:hypothetical protein